jgi:competence ComEA-like helix-hairpin-helix protein
LSVSRRRAALGWVLGLLVASALGRSLPHALQPAQPLAAEPCQVMYTRSGTQPPRVTQLPLGLPPRGRLALLVGCPLDVNTASAVDLSALPRVGDKLAQRIVQDREAAGPFRTLKDLDRVRGVGPKTVARLAPYIRVGTPGRP